MDLKMLKKKLKPKKRKDEEDRVFLSTGSTVLNCAFSNNPFGGWLTGKCYLAVGDSASGKTALCLTCLAEASIDPRFDDYELVMDDIEGGALFDITKLFGERLQERLTVLHSVTLEEMYYNIDERLKKKKKFIYVTDSMDGLYAQEDEDKFQERKKAFEKLRDTGKSKEVAGSFGTKKAKLNSDNLRRLMNPLRDTGSIVILIVQTRENLGFGFDKKTHGGGKSLNFYATLAVWSSIKKKIKKNVAGKDRTIGILSKLDVKKNRITGREGSVDVPIFYTYGFDELGSCIDYLIDEKHWKKSGSKITASEFGFTGTKDKLIKYIEKKGKQRKLAKIVGRVWNEIEAGCTVDRKSRYE